MHRTKQIVTLTCFAATHRHTQALHTPAASSSTVLALSGQQPSSFQTRCFSKESDAAAASSANEAPEAAGKDGEQQAAANEEALDPKDQLIADKDQQVCDCAEC